jgi:hypothetical protein
MPTPPEEKSVSQLISEALQVKENEYAQYERILYKLGAKKAELQVQLTALNEQFKGVEYLLNETKKAVSILGGGQRNVEVASPKPTVEYNQIEPSQSRKKMYTYTSGRINREVMTQKIVDAFKSSTDKAMSTQEIYSVGDFPSLAALNSFVAAANKQINVLVRSSTVKYKPNSCATVFYELGEQFK